MRSRNYQNFDAIAETALEEESAIASQQERYRAEGASVYSCSIARSQRDGTRAETRRGPSAKRTSPFKSPGGGVSSVDCWQPRCGIS